MNGVYENFSLRLQTGRNFCFIVCNYCLLLKLLKKALVIELGNKNL